tara:strand:- start:228 stop:572 length:345 start_codon:yes stop_codon:yes gene_type:complete
VVGSVVEEVEDKKDRVLLQIILMDNLLEVVVLLMVILMLVVVKQMTVIVESLHLPGKVIWILKVGLQQVVEVVVDLMQILLVLLVVQVVLGLFVLDMRLVKNKQVPEQKQLVVQ